MPQETRIALLLLGELVSALRANDPDAFKRWPVGGVEDLGKSDATAEKLKARQDPQGQSRGPCILGTSAWLSSDRGPEISVFSPVIAFDCCSILFDGRGQRT